MRVPHYLGAGFKVGVDGSKPVCCAYPPYQVELGKLPAGDHMLQLTLLGHRCNSFGPVHLADEKHLWIGPTAWRTVNDEWTDEYRLKTEGVLSAPVIEEK